MRITIAIVLFITTTSSFIDDERPASWAVKIESTSLENLYKVSSDLYRSEQPSVKGMAELQELGIKTIINFRSYHQDKKELKRSELKSVYVPIKSTDISYNNLLTALQEIKRAEKPVLIHCWHGADRTGAAIAVYRMAIQGWEKQKAIDEFRNGDFGYHEELFPNILALLESIDIDALKKDLAN